MNWMRTTQELSNLLCLILIVRLFALRLHHVYRVFAIFLLYEICSTLIVFAQYYFHNGLDYRITWMILQIGAWPIWLWMVYALLQAILANLPGLLRISRTALNYIFPASILVSAISASGEFHASGASNLPGNLDRVVTITLVVTRVVSTVALLTLLLMLLFILWFPVKMPRNLAAFSVGFVLYFCGKTTLILLHIFVSPANFELLDCGIAVVLSICYLYWLFILNKQGETVPVILGHRWRASDQTHLMRELETINSQLLRAARR